MKFTTTTSELLRSLSRVHAVVPTKSTSPILENVLCDLLNDVLTITATDMDISLAVTMNVNGTEDGRIAIPAKRLLDTVRALPETSITFSIDTTTNKIQVSTGTGEYNLTGESAKEFPPLPQFKGKEQLALDTATLKRLIHRTAFAVSADELRPAMMGVLFQSHGTEFRAVATDGHRLVRCIQKLPAPSGVTRDIIVPAKALMLIGRSLEGTQNTIAISDTHLRITFEQTTLVARLIDETYPNYESVIPQDNDKVMSVRREEMVASLRRVALYASATTHQVRFQMGKSSVNVSAQDVDFGGEARETIPCEYSGNTLEIGFNSTYLIDILTHMDDERVSFRFSSPTRAGIVTPSSPATGEDLTMLVMPVRLNA
jgi:DNA polymerase III subunit beta